MIWGFVLWNEKKMEAVLLSPAAAVPKRSSVGAAGFDVRATSDGVVPARFDYKHMAALLAASLFL